MADNELESHPTESYRLYAAWRTARAKWELAQFDPAHLGKDLPEELDAKHCDEDQSTLLAFLAHPAETLQDLARKLSTLQSEGAYRFAEADEIIAQLAADANKLSISDALARERRDDRKGSH